jgi:hypothetical protein
MNKFLSYSLSLLAFSFLIIINGCQREDEDRFTAADATDISEEAVVDSYFQDVDDIATVAIHTPDDAEYSGGRTSGEIIIQDNRLACTGVVVTITPGINSTVDNPYGLLTVDFGTGCTDAKGNVRKGKLIFNYTGKRFESGSSVVMTTDDYYINGIRLEGTRTSTNITASLNDAPKFHVTVENGKAIFPDNSVALRESDITWSWIRESNPALDKLIVHSNSTANGVTRVGRSYAVSLLQELEYHRFCSMAVSGIKKFVIDGEKEITFNYGEGDCDTIFTVTMNGFSKTITL